MRSRQGLTLLELVVVLALLVGLSTVLVPLFSGTIGHASEIATTRTLCAIRDSIQEYHRDTKLIALDGIGTTAIESERFDIIWLFRNPVSGDLINDFNPATRIGWRGPYVVTSTGNQTIAGYPYLIDAWNREIVVQVVDYSSQILDIRVVSAGPDGVITIPESSETQDLTSANTGDDIYVALSLQ